MPYLTPQFNEQDMQGGFMAALLENLPRFTRNPKGQDALYLVPNGSPVSYGYISVQNTTLYLHTQPLETPAYTPELSFDLTQYSVATLATTLNGKNFGYTVTAAGNKYDGSTAALMLGFHDYALNGSDMLDLQIATPNVYKFFYPIAQALYQGAGATQDAEFNLNMPFGAGFWLDFWGDWFNVPRLPSMTDAQYVAYLLWNLRVPKVNNMAIEDILMAQYKVPITVEDSGLYQFTINIDASQMGIVSTDTIAPIVNEVKAAGIAWLLDYASSFTENYEAYFAGRTGTTFVNSDSISSSISTPLLEQEYGVYDFGFMIGGNQTGTASQFNDSSFGGGKRLSDTFTMSAQATQGPFYEAMYGGFTGFALNDAMLNDAQLGTSGRQAQDVLSMAPTVSQTELYKGTAAEKSLGLWLSMQEARYGYDTATGFMLGDSALNDSTLGGGYKLKDIMSMSGAATWSYTERNLKKEGSNTSYAGAPYFGTCGGNLLATFNDSGFGSFQKESVQMFYNTRTDASFTIM